VLIYSTMGKAWWQCGKLAANSMTFVPERSGILDYGSFYAPKTQLDKAGNRILWGWITETRPVDEYKAAGWAGMMSLPRVLTLNADGDLRMSVAPEVQQLRGPQQKIAPGGKTQGHIEQVRLRSCCGEVHCLLRRGSVPCALSFAGSSEAQHWLTVRYDPAHRDEVLVEDRPVPVSFGANGDVELHAFADGSVIEILIAGRAAWTKRFYYRSKQAQDLLLRWDGDSAGVLDLSAWQITPISNDRLTT
jgi:beta-fructofuranosidase